MSATKILQMYSYKGGSGRTVSTANIGCILAKEYGKKVVCIDMDVEGGGLGVVFGVHEKLEQDENRKCVQDIFEEGAQIKSPQDFLQEWWGKIHYDIGEIKSDDSLKNKLFLIPARFGGIPVASTSETANTFKIFLNELKESIKPDYILIDSSSGFQAWTILCMEYSQILLLFFRWNNQSIEGTIQSIKHIKDLMDNRDISIRKLIVIPSAVPRSSLDIKKYKDISDASKRKLKLKTGVENDPSIQIMYEGIEEAIGLKWEEKLLNLSINLEADELATLQDLRNISRIIVEL